MPPILETICEDEFLQSIEKDILFYLDNSCKNRQIYLLNFGYIKKKYYEGHSYDCLVICFFLSQTYSSEHFLNYYSVLLFPPVNNYRRFLIHKVCGNIISQSQPRPRSIVSFSIGVDEHRRTVICDQNQLRIDLKKTSQNRHVTFFNSAFTHLFNICFPSTNN